MRMRPWLLIASVSVAALVTVIGGCTQVALPPLLRNVSSGGGSTDVCPTEGGDVSNSLAMIGSASSPELDQRLQREFPPGSGEGGLVNVLIEQRFVVQATPCGTDSSIHLAIFRQTKGLFFPTMATVWWKVDQQNNIVWTEGFVFYDG
jgi:hypothetical protein